jgi:hypothetical protein
MRATYWGTITGALLAALAVSSGPADAGPLLVSIQGFLPTLTVTQQTILLTPDDRTPLPPLTQTLTNVPFTAQFTFDSARWALATQDPAGLPGFQQLIDVDPPAPLTSFQDPGISTDEWLRGSLTLGLPTPQTLALDRDFITNRPANAQTIVGFNGAEGIGYLDGNAAAGDWFQLFTSGAFGYGLDQAPPAPTDPFELFQSWSFGMSVLQGPDPGGSFVDLFGPGAPTSFVWDDPTPITCATGTDCLPQGTAFGQLQFETDLVFLDAPGLAHGDVMQYAGNLLFTHVTLEPLPDPVPEPATLATAGVGLMAMLAARRRPAGQQRVGARARHQRRMPSNRSVSRIRPPFTRLTAR